MSSLVPSSWRGCASSPSRCTRTARRTPKREASSWLTRSSSLVSSRDAGDAHILLIDEALTPDSSRFWPRERYEPGGPQPSFDKQYVRDYLDRIKWDRRPPVPKLPAEVVENTRAKYVEAFRSLTGHELD